MPFIGETSALITAALWAMTSIFIANVSAKVGAAQTNIDRMLIAMAFLLATIFVFDIPFALSSTQFRNLVLSAVVGIVFGDTFLFKAFQQIGARLTMLMMTLAPAILAILAYFFLGETLSWTGITGILVTLLGVALVIFERTAPTPRQYQTITRFGILCATLGALGQGCGVVFAKLAFAAGDLHGLVASFIRISSAVAILLPIMTAAGYYNNPVTVFRAKRQLIPSLFIVAFFGTYAGITLSLVAVAYAKVGIASTLISTSPVLMLPMVKIAYRETLSPTAIVGAIIAVSGVAILFLL